MAFCARLLALYLVGIVAAPTVFAEDLEELAAAQKALDAAPAYRVTITGTSSMTEGTNQAVMEIVHPDLMRDKVELDGKPDFEAFSDGKKTVMSEQGGLYKEAPLKVATMLETYRGQCSIQAPNGDDLSHKVRQMKLDGHETLNGTPASLYTGEDTEKPDQQNDHMMMRDTHSLVKIWVSDRDHRPLQAEWHLDGTLEADMVPAGKGGPFKQDMKMTFEYDPTIKITLPAVP